MTDNKGLQDYATFIGMVSLDKNNLMVSHPNYFQRCRMMNLNVSKKNLGRLVMLFNFTPMPKEAQKNTLEVTYCTISASEFFKDLAFSKHL